MRVFVEAIADVLGAHEEFNLVDLIFRQVALLLHFANLLNALFLVRGDFELVFVAPKDTGGCAHPRL